MTLDNRDRRSKVEQEQQQNDHFYWTSTKEKNEIQRKEKQKKLINFFLNYTKKNLIFLVIDVD